MPSATDDYKIELIERKHDLVAGTGLR
jgi:hypothetical protein